MCGVGVWYSDGEVTARVLLMRMCASVQASETDGMDPKSEVMTVTLGSMLGDNHRQPRTERRCRYKSVIP